MGIHALGLGLTPLSFLLIALSSKNGCAGEASTTLSSKPQGQSSLSVRLDSTIKPLDNDVKAKIPWTRCPMDRLNRIAESLDMAVAPLLHSSTRLVKQLNSFVEKLI